jgi:hypothetical protein
MANLNRRRITYLCNMNIARILFILFLYNLWQIPLYGQVFFRTNDFKVLEKDLSLNGTASVQGDILRLTPARPALQATCWYTRKKIDLSKGFETEFTFRLHGGGPGNAVGDGFAFVLHNQGFKAIGASGDGLGYKGIKNAVVIEFDTHQDEGDKSKNQVALMRYNPSSGKYEREATVHEIRELSNGEEHFARIEYRNGFLTFFLDSYLFPVLSYKIDIAERIGASDQQAIIGFSAATGTAYSNQDILSWSLGEYLPPPEDIKEEEIEILQGEVVEVVSRDLIISVWDHNRIDGDIVSLKVNKDYILTNYTLEAVKKQVPYRLTGFNAQLILYAHNLGEIPPNTAAIEIDDGTNKHVIKLKATLKQSESLVIQYVGDDL